MKFSRMLSTLLLLALALSVVGGAGAQDGKIVNISYTQEPDNLNPMYSSMFFAGITRDLYLTSAWYFDENLNLVPGLVSELPSLENGGINEDGTVFTLRLRDDIVWSDGTAITANDFVFTYNMVMAESNAVASRDPYDKITSVEATDEQTVVVTFAEPYAPWAVRLFGYVLPAHVLQPVFDAEGTLDAAEWNRAPTVASGPFVYAEWVAGSHLLFTRNEAYFGPRPNLDGVFIRFVAEEAQTAALESGEADLATFIPLADAQQLQANNEALQLLLVPSGYNESWYFNVREGLGHPALQDARVRRALVMGTNLAEINETLNGGLVEQPVSFWHGTPYARPDAAAIAFDPEGAAALLDEAGWTDTNGDGTRDDGNGTELVLRYVTTTREIRGQVAAVTQDQLADIGVTIEIDQQDGDIFFATVAEGGLLSTGQYDIAELSINPAFPDPDTQRFVCAEVPTETEDGANDSGICLEELDALFAEQLTLADTNARIEVFHQIDAILAEQVVWVGLWEDPDLWMYNSRVTGLRVNGPNPFWNAYEWDLTG